MDLVSTYHQNLAYTADDLIQGRDEVSVVHLDAWAKKFGVPGYLESRGVTRPILSVRKQYTVVAPNHEHLVMVEFDRSTARVYDSWPNDAYHDSAVALVYAVADEIRLRITNVEFPECPKQTATSRTCGYHVARCLLTVPFGVPPRAMELPRRQQLNDALVEVGRCVSL